MSRKSPEEAVGAISGVLELAKKYGWTSIITVLIAVVPIFFAIDARYAKAKYVQANMQQMARQQQKLEQAEAGLAEQLNQIEGAQQTILAILVAKSSDGDEAAKLAALSQQLSSTEDALKKLQAQPPPK